MEELYADYVVIGSGPAGQKGAIQAAKLGKSVVLIEKENSLGGVSLHSGTIPSKTLREAILDLTGFYAKDASLNAAKNISIHELNSRVHKVVTEQSLILLRQFEKNKIRLFCGVASFEDPHHVIVKDDNGKITHRIKGSSFLIATGSRPRNPFEIPFDQHTVLDSTRLLEIDRIPKTLLVLGGGIIGSEYASFFSALGTKVTVLDKRDHLLPGLDREMGIHLLTALKEMKLQFVGGEEFKKINKQASGVEVECKSGLKLQSEVLLFALGREANVELLAIQNAGLSLDNNGYIPVNALFQTLASHIYAVGDVIDGPSLASTSMEQGRLAARHAFGAKTHHFPTFYPIGIYTIPEISYCGYTEQQLQENGFRYEVGRAYYYEIARNQIIGNEPGMFKILFHSETLEILGVHIIGRAATEVIHIGQVAMSFNSRIDYFIDQIFNYPTYAEGYRIAALNGYNKVKHKR